MMRTERKAAATPLAVLLGFEVAAIVGLHALGSSHGMQVPWGDFTTWFSTGSIDEVAAPLIRVSALAIAYWMFVSTALTVVAQISRIPAAVRATSMFTLPSVRRVVDSAMVVSIATTSVVGMGTTAVGAQTDSFPDVTSSVPVVNDGLSVSTPRPTTAQADITTSTEAQNTTTTEAETTTTLAQIPGDSGSGSVSTPRPTTSAGGDTTTSPPTTEATTTSTTAAPQTTTTVPTPAAPEAAPDAAEVLGASEHRVVAGDNLWTIARDALVQAGNTDPTEAEVRDYWLVVIEANRDNLRSNDPHWIFPGEIINLPAMTATAGS